MVRRFTGILAGLALLGTIILSSPSNADVPDAFQSVVSVLPVWKGRPQGGSSATRGAAPEGSGVIIRQGVVATSWHVIEPAEKIDVRLQDGRILPARLIASDPASDIALLAVETDAPVLEIAPMPSLTSPVCAIGNAFGLGLSVTCGVVSATFVTDAGFNAVEDFVQTDAAVNPGMSGGALVDGAGRLVGQLSAIFASDADTNIGVNFAVSTELLQRVAEELLANGVVEYASAGWRLGQADPAQLRTKAGAVVRGLSPDGPAAKAVVQRGDLIRRIGSRPIRKPRDAVAALAVSAVPGTAVEVLLDRDGSERSVTLRFEEAPSNKTTASSANEQGDCSYAAAICQMRQAVFPISSFDPIASATRIAPTLLVTNRHVIADQKTAVVHTPSGPREAHVVPSAYRGDLVLLEVDGLPADGFVPALDEAPTSSGQSYFAIGADVARQAIRVFDPGTLIAGPAEGAAFGRLHVTSRMQPGVSGGALVDEAGRLAGIAVGGGEGRYEAIPASDLAVLLALRKARDVAAEHAKLGSSFAACAALLDQYEGQRPDEAGAAEILGECGAADNHGQLLRSGRVFARSGFFAEAAQLHGRAAEKVPNSINARVSLLVSLQLGGRFEDMIPHARWLMEMASDDPRALRFGVQAGVWGGDTDLAEAAYQRLLEADPRQAQAARRFIDDAPPAPPKR